MSISEKRKREFEAARNERDAYIARAQALRNAGETISEIAKKMLLPESAVLSLLKGD